MYEITAYNKDDLKQAVVELGKIAAKGKYPVVVSVKSKKDGRSLAQNALMWKWMREIRDHLLSTGSGQEFSVEEIKEFLRDRYAPRKEIGIGEETVSIPKGTSELEVDEFSRFLKDIDEYCSMDVGLSLSHPEDMYYEAMGWHK